MTTGVKIALWILSILTVAMTVFAIIFAAKYYKKSGKTLTDIIASLPIFETDEAAKAGGLKIGDSYKKADGTIKTVLA